jgi:hypothetical protein
MKIKRVISIVLLSLFISLFQGVPVANAAGVPTWSNFTSNNPNRTPDGYGCQWEFAPAVAENGSSLTNYLVTLRTGSYTGTIFKEDIPISPAITSTTLIQLSVDFLSGLGISQNVTYYYSLRPVNAYSPGGAQHPVGGAAAERKDIGSCPVDRILSPGTPGTPTVVAGDASATVTIVAPTTGNSPSSYTVTAFNSSGTTAITPDKTCTVTVPATSCTVSGLTNGTAYTFKSTASNSAGTSSQSAASLAATPSGTVIPSITNVTSSTTNGSYKVGDVISVQVTFTEAVTVSGTPQLTLETGSTDQVLNYASGSGTDTLTFSYTIQAGDTSSDLTYVATDSLALNSGTIKNSANTDAILTLPAPTAAGSLAANKSIVVDTTLPTVSSFSSTTADGSYKEGATINITATLSEVVTTSASITATLSNGQTVVLTHNAVNNTLTGSYAIGAGQSSSDLGVSSYALTSAPVDSAGNVMTSTTMPDGNISGTRAIVVDTSAPTASLTAATVIGSGNATVQSSEAGTAYLVKSTVNVTSLASITGAADSLWNSVSVTASTNTNLSVSGLDLGEYVLYVTDAAGNLSAVSTNTVTVSMGAPSTPDLNSSSDLGSSSTDNQTADDTPTIDLTGLTTGAVVTVTATPSSGSAVTCSFTATSGSGSCTFSSLANQTYSFKASQTLSGVTSSDSSNLSGVVIYKTTLTPTVTLDLNTLDDLGSSSTDNITSATTLRITSSSGGVSYTTSGGSGSNSNCTSGCSFGTFSSGVITFTGSPTTDTYGNTATPTLQVTVNTSSPTLSSVSASSVAGTTANLNFTSNQEGTYFYLVLAASDPAPDAATIIAQGASVQKGTSSALASTNTVGISGLSESTAYKTYLVVRHPAGGVSAVSNVAMTTTIAVPSVPDLAAESDLGSSSTDNSTADNTPTFDLSGLTSGASVTVTATPSTGSPVTCTFTASGSTGSCTFSALTNGTYSVKVKQRVGDVDSADSVALTGLVINSQSISTPATPDLTSGSDLGSSATDNVTNDDTPTISVSGTFTGTAVVTATKAGSSDVTCTIVSGSCTLGTLADGTWSLTVTDSTAAGSTATSSALSLTIDTGRPTAALTTGTIFASGNASVQSSELGTAYLVRNSVIVSDLASITSQAGNVWNTVSIAAVNTATNLPATGLTAGTYLLYTVDAAGNLSLVSAQSVVVAVETPGAPGQPTVVAGDTQATITVVAPTSGDAPTSYTIQASDSSGVLAGKTCTVTGASGSCVVSGLTNGTAYTFTSTATNTGGTSSASSSSASATPTDTPVAPQVSATSAPTGTLVNGNTLTSAVTFTGTPTPTPAYTWQRCTSSSELSTCVAISGATSATYALTDADAGKFIRTVVTATNGTGSIVGTSAVTTAIAAIAAGAPTSLSAAASDGAAIISFTPGNTGGATITNYKYSTDGTNYIALNPADASSPVTISGLTNGTAYTIYLKAVNSAGDSVGSSSVSVTPVDNVSPTLSGAVLAANGTTLTLTFSEALNATTAAASAYVVTANGVAVTVSSAVVSESTVVLTLATAVDQGRTVLVSYTDPTSSNDSSAVQDSTGNDTATFTSQSVTNNSTNITVPGRPGTATAVAGNAQATVTVSAPTTGGTPTSYTVTASPGSATCTVTGASGSCTVTGLTNGTAYTFTSSATNISGTSVDTSTASSAITPSAPVAPVGPSAPAPEPEPVCEAACIAAQAAAAKAAADKVIADRVAAEAKVVAEKIASDTAAKVVADKVVVDKSAAEAAAKTAIDKATAAAVAKATAEAAAGQAAAIAKAAADAQATAVVAAANAAAALRSATTSAASRAAATAKANRAATTASNTVQAAAAAAKVAATARAAASNASKQVDIALGALNSKTAAATTAAQANAIAAAAKAAANKAAKVAADQARAAKVASNNANREASAVAARIATEQKEAADAATQAKIATDAVLRATEEMIAAATDAQRSAEAVVKALEEKIALAEASVKAKDITERAAIDKKIEEVTVKVAEAQRVADAANARAEATVTAQEKAQTAATAAAQEAQVQAAEAVAVRDESTTKTAVASKAAADASLAAKVATAAKAAAAKVPAKAVIAAKPGNSSKKNSATATISGLKPGQKVKVTVNVKGK